MRYTVISEVSNLMRRTLWDGFLQADEQITDVIKTIDAIGLMNPADAKDDFPLSLWLYQVQQNEFLRNTPQARVPGDDGLVQFPPLAINLFYLLTPKTKNDDTNQLILGRSMQIFHDNAILLLETKATPKQRQELRIMMCHRDLRELAEVWEALQQPYRLSVCYEVRVPAIDSLRRERSERVGERRFDFDDDTSRRRAS